MFSRDALEEKPPNIILVLVDDLGWYDLEKDLSETNNLAETFPELTEELNQDIDLWLEKTKARIPLPNPSYHKTD